MRFLAIISVLLALIGCASDKTPSVPKVTASVAEGGATGPYSLSGRVTLPTSAVAGQVTADIGGLGPTLGTEIVKLGVAGENLPTAAIAYFDYELTGFPSMTDGKVCLSVYPTKTALSATYRGCYQGTARFALSASISNADVSLQANPLGITPSDTMPVGSTVTFTVSGGTGPFSWMFSPPGDLAGSTQTTSGPQAEFVASQTGVYLVSVSDTNGFTFMVNVTAQ